MGLIGSTLASVVSGGLTGIIGTVFQSIFGWLNTREQNKQQKLKWDHDLDMKNADMALMKLEAEGNLKVAEQEAAGKEAQADAAAFNTSLTAEPKLYSEGVKKGPIEGAMLVFVDFVRGLIRPGVTIYLCVLTTLLYFSVKALLGDGAVLTSEQAVLLLTEIINTVLYLTTTCVTWWFGTRMKQVPPAPTIRH